MNEILAVHENRSNFCLSRRSLGTDKARQAFSNIVELLPALSRVSADNCKKILSAEIYFF